MAPIETMAGVSRLEAASGVPGAERVLVAEPIGERGVRALELAGFEVDFGYDWPRTQLEDRIGGYDAILIRSATMVDAELVARATRLRVVARAGVGLDNVDLTTATRAGIIVINAPHSNTVTAAEHTMGLLLALARNIPQAHGALTGGRWERARFSGTELMGKTLGILGFGRIGQLVARRAQAFDMKIIAYDPFVASSIYVNLKVERAKSPNQVYRGSDFLTLHMPTTSETNGMIDASAFSEMRDGVRLLNVARGTLIVDEDLKAALDSGKVGGAALDVFRAEPITDHPLFGYPNVVVTPHLGASTAEATDRAGFQAAEQVVAALRGEGAATAVNVQTMSGKELELLRPFLALCRQLGKLAIALASPGSIDKIEIGCHGTIGEIDTGPFGVAVVLGALGGHTEDSLNEVNALAIAGERGIEIVQSRSPSARDFTDLVRVMVWREGVRQDAVVGTTIGMRHRPHLVEAWGQEFNLKLERYVTLFRYRNVPGMLGRVGNMVGAYGLNIGPAVIGHTPDDVTRDDTAVMAFTTDSLVPQSLLDEILATSDFLDGRTVSLTD